MEKFITYNALYLTGSFEEVLREIKRLSREFKTVRDYIHVFLN